MKDNNSKLEIDTKNIKFKDLEGNIYDFDDPNLSDEIKKKLVESISDPSGWFSPFPGYGKPFNKEDKERLVKSYVESMDFIWGDDWDREEGTKAFSDSIVVDEENYEENYKKYVKLNKMFFGDDWEDE